MKRYWFWAALVFLFAGCATNNNISTQDRDVPLSTDEAYCPPARSPQAPVVPKAKKTAAKPSKTEPVESRSDDDQEAPKPGRYSLEMKVNDDDDITKLLSTNYSQNFDIPIVFNDAVKYYIKWFSDDKKKVFTNWLKRSRLYVPMIREILRENDMPEDLVYLAMIESGFNPKAYSTAQASGPWQFIYSTGGRYGLEVSYWVDERRDPAKSTVAAAKYLKALFDQFGCWYLAAAGYNAGEGRIGRLTQKHNTMDFWELHKYNTLPKETRNYVPQLIAAAIIAKDPAKFGFGSITYDPPIRFAEVKVPSATPMSSIAKASSVTIDIVRTYNPEILRGITPPGKNDYVVKLPADVNTGAFYERLGPELESIPVLKSITTYKVKKKDSIASILKKNKIDQKDLVLLNSSDNDLRIKPGMVLAIPKFSGEKVRESVALADTGENVPQSVVQAQIELVVPAISELRTVKKNASDKPVLVATVRSSAPPKIIEKPSETRPAKGRPTNTKAFKTFHVVKRGETLSDISDLYGIDEDSLRSANKLKGSKVYPNMKLRLVSHTEPKEETKKTEPTHFKKVRYHTVKKGETLTSISDKYGVDIDDLKSANKIKGNKINRNAKLKIVMEG
jgi:membrane-bound lytic murein transglycosylase D